MSDDIHIVKNRVVLNKRIWLNPSTSRDTGAIHSTIEVGGTWVDGSIAIWDCSRKISLVFDYNTSKGKKARLKKLDLLIGALVEFRDVLERTNI